MGNMLLNLDEFVRVTQTTGDEIVGRYDGVDYTFPDGEPVDVHKAVATHVFGFGLPEESNDPRVQDKTPALLRLNWLSSSADKKHGLETLRTRVKFEEIPPFPTVLRLRQPEENTGQLQADSTELASRVPSSPPLGGGGSHESVAPANPKTLGLPKSAKG
jgi:hypothetical protein